MAKVVFFCGDISRDGGTERVCTLISSGLANLHHEVIVVSVCREYSEMHFSISPLVQCHVLCKRFPAPGVGWLSVRSALKRYLSELEPEIVITVDGVLDVIARPVTSSLGIKLFSWEQFQYNLQFAPGYRRLLRPYSALADQIIVPDESEIKYYRNGLNSHAPIIDIPNPCGYLINNADPFPSKENLLLSVGNLYDQKGFDLLARCAASVLKMAPDWRWAVVGLSEKLDLIKQYCDISDVSDRIILPGFVSDISSWYSKASILVHCSRSEGLTLTLLEARSFGCPIIAFDVPLGPQKLVSNEETGLLIEPFDTDSMSNAILSLIFDADKRHMFGENARKNLEPYNIKRVVEQWDSLIRRSIPSNDNQ